MRLVLWTLIGLLGLVPAKGLSHDDPGAQPKNIVFIVADGMGLAHIGLAIHSTRQPINLERFPVMGLQKTHSKSHLITDSGAAATALSCGLKTYNSAIGMGSDTTPCVNLMELAERANMKRGLVVTSSLAHATPGAFVAHQEFRGFREAIAADLVQADLDYVVGGGMMYFNQRFVDDRNLIEEMEDNGYFVGDYNNLSFKSFMKKSYQKAIYFTANIEPNTRLEGRAYFPKAVSHGLHFLDGLSDDGFFFFVEASQIDFAAHNNDKPYLVAELKDFDQMLSEVIMFAEEDGETLVVVTADHSTGGLALIGGKANSPNAKGEFSTTRHTADMVPVFAMGPGAELFSGVYENTEIFEKIRSLAGF